VTSTSLEALIRAVERLEDQAASYITLDEVHATVGDVSDALESHVLLVDYRTRADGTAVTLCRLNRRHPDVVRLTSAF
jgi:hypothetical protein